MDNEDIDRWYIFMVWFIVNFFLIRLKKIRKGNIIGMWFYNYWKNVRKKIMELKFMN